MMTIIFFKRTGEIYTILEGTHTLSIFGDYEQDFNQILEVLTVVKHIDVLWNAKLFKINTDTKEVELKHQLVY